MENSNETHQGRIRFLGRAASGLLVGTAAILAFSAAAHAGTTGTEFQGAYDTVMDIAGGYGGKLVALGAFVAGVVGGVARQNPMIFAGATATAIGVAVGPGVVDSLVGALI